jgi:hypothetical protein
MELIVKIVSGAWPRSSERLTNVTTHAAAGIGSLVATVAKSVATTCQSTSSNVDSVACEPVGDAVSTAFDMLGLLVRRCTATGGCLHKEAQRNLE